MSTISIRDQRLAGATMLPDDFIDYYMPRANGDFVKIYLFLLRSVHAQTPAPTISSLADVFRLTERDVDRALRYWQEAGLLDLKYKGEELDEITAKAQAKMDAAVEFAMNSPEPDPAHVLDDVFYEG